MLAVEGISNFDIAENVGTSGNAMTAWRSGSGQAGISRLAYHDRFGRLWRIDHRALVAATLRSPPKELGVMHWSSRLLETRWASSKPWWRRHGENTGWIPEGEHLQVLNRA